MILFLYNSLARKHYVPIADFASDKDHRLRVSGEIRTR